MPLANCPSCATALRVPEGSVAAVRCPKCQTVFSPAGGNSPPPPTAPRPAASRPAFGSGGRPSPPLPPPAPLPGRPAGSGVRPALPPPSNPGPNPPPPKRPPVLLPPRSTVRPTPLPPPEPEFEVVDAVPAPEPEVAFSFDAPAGGRPRKARLLDDPADDDRPRRAKLADDENDDRSRGRRKGDRDDGRPRGRRRGRYEDDYDDEDDWYDEPGRRNPYRPAAIGSLLVAISLWVYLGVFGTMALVAILGWTGGNTPNVLFVLAGAAGLGNWVTAGVGLGFLLAGPEKARGVTIAATVLAGVQLVIMAVIAVEITDGVRALAVLGVGGNDGLVLLPFITLIPAVDAFLPALYYSNKAGAAGDVPWQALFAVLGGGCEIARLILVTLALGAHGRAARDYTADERARAGVMGVSWICGAAAVLTLVVVLMIVEGKMAKSARHLAGASGLLIFVGYALMVLFPALAAHAARAGLLRKARKTDKAARDRDW